MRLAVAFVAMTGCSQIFGLTNPERGDAGGTIDSSLSIDASGDATPPGSCTAKWQSGNVALSTPTALGIDEPSNDEQSPFVTADGTELFYSRNGTLTRATRSILSADFTNRQGVAVGSSGTEGKLFMAPTKTRGFYSSARTGGSGSYDIWRAFRSQPSGGWSVDQMYLGNVNTGSTEADPHLTDDLLHLYIAGVPTTSASQQIMLATRATVNDAFGTPTAISELSSNTGESGPTLTADELVIVYSSNKLAPTAPGPSNLWYATRAKTSDPFGSPRLVPTVNTDSFDTTPHLSEDGCTLYWSSAKAGSYDLYMSTVQ